MFQRYSPSQWSEMKLDFIKKDPEIELIFTQKIVHDDPETFHRENNFTNYSFIEDHYVKARFKLFSKNSFLNKVGCVFLMVI